MSERSQRWVLWWGIAFAVIYGLTLLFLLHLVPPPSPKMSTAEIAQWYADRHDSIRLGAVIASYCAAWFLPMFAVIVVQMARLDVPRIWPLLTAFGSVMMSIFLVLPPLMMGAAAYTQDRAPGATQALHELAMLTLITTDQFYIFAWVGITVVCFLPVTVKHSPFNRRFGYFTAWTAFMLEAGGIAFLPRTGPFAWNGLLTWWSPLVLVGVWLFIMFRATFRCLRAQENDAADAKRQGAVSKPSTTKVA